MAVTGAIFKALTFDGTSSRNYGVYITGEAVYNAPARVVEMVEIAGRNGALAMDMGRFENIEVTYHAGIYANNQSDFATAVSNFRNLLCSKVGYCRLTDEYNSTEYRMAVYKNGLEVTPVMLKAGEFDIVFDCKPQRFLMSGEAIKSVSSGSTITNPTLFESRPLIQLTGAGTLTIGNVRITSTAPSGSTVYIDCDSMEIYCYNGSTLTNGSSYISFSTTDFPTLATGTSTITISGVTNVKITPRWWKI